MLIHTTLSLCIAAGALTASRTEAPEFIAVPFMHSMPTYMPIGRVIENLRAKVSEEPENRENYVNLGRAHSYAFQVSSLGKLVETRTVLTKTPQHFRVSNQLPRGPITGQDAEEENIEIMPMSARLHHLTAAIAAFQAAIDMEPLEPSAYLGMADLLASCKYEAPDAGTLPYPAFPSRYSRQNSVTFFLGWLQGEDLKLMESLLDAMSPASERPQHFNYNQPTRTMIDALLVANAEADGQRRERYREVIREYWEYQTGEYFLCAFMLSFGEDAYHDSMSSLSSFRDLVAWEAGTRYLAHIREHGAQDYDKARMELVEAGIKGLESIPRYEAITPIIFSLSAPAPLESLLAPETVVHFDLDGTGREQSWPWVSPEASILVWDPEETGEVTSGRQLFGSVTWWLFFDDGYRAMDALDDNRDGELAGDELAGLSIWTDANSNAVSDPGEVVPIGLTGIEAISCRQTDTTMGMPANLTGLRMTDGRVLPTYDWVATEVQQEPAEKVGVGG